MTREEILQAFNDINFVYNDCTRYDTLKRMLEELTERKRGEWINDADKCVTTCSSCRKELRWIKYDRPHNFLFCPNCGADIRGDEDER